MKANQNMNPGTRVASSALCAALLAGAVPAGLALSPVGASAAAPIGTVKIAPKDNKTPNTYSVFQVFIAEGGIDDEDNASQLKWNEAYQSTVMAYLNANGYAAWLTEHGHTGDDAADVPQNAAEFISYRISAAPKGTGTYDAGAATTPGTPAGDSFALGLAKALRRSGVAPTATHPASTTTNYSNTEGFYLFVTTDDSIENSEAGTAPIWVPLGGSTNGLTITEKTAVPTLVKNVIEDRDSANGEWGKVADANAAQDLKFRLKGTMPQNLGAFSFYRYQFTDTLPVGMDMKGGNVSSVVVKVYDNAGDTTPETVTSDITGTKGSITYDSATRVLKVNFNDILTLKSGLTVTKDSIVTVEYDAHINTDAEIIGNDGYTNDAYLSYTKNPVGPGTGSGGTGSTDSNEDSTLTETPHDTTTVFTYELELLKLDKQTTEPLAGAGFKIQVANTSSDTASRGKWLAADGSLVDEAHAYEFVTGTNGKFNVKRIDEGVYTIKETTVPTGYNKTSDITLTVTSTLDPTTRKTSFATDAVSFTGGDTTKINDEDEVTFVSYKTDGSSGKIDLKTPNQKKILMPITGMDGATAALVYGLGAVVIGGLGWTLSSRMRKRREAGEK